MRWILLTTILVPSPASRRPEKARCGQQALQSLSKQHTLIVSLSLIIDSWTIRNSKVYVPDRVRELHRRFGDFPPDSIAKLGTFLPGIRTVEEQSSSLVITGDPSGYLWICSMWSPVSDTDSITPVIRKVLPKILGKFIHQQGSARCLVFLVLLGHLCEKLAVEYAKIVRRLDKIMEIGVCTFPFVGELQLTA